MPMNHLKAKKNRIKWPFYYKIKIIITIAKKTFCDFGILR